MKVDLHLHSKHSKRPSQWILQKINCPESFAEPAMLDRLRRRAGMDALTLTDHNTIDGALEIAHLPEAFISEEVTTYFPEDGCKVHVLVYDIDERIHEDISRIRENIYDLTTYLNQAGIFHAVAHCLFSVNDRLKLEHFEKFLLLFKTFELNGARDDAQNQVLKAVLQNIRRRDIVDLAEKHSLAPNHPEPHLKRFIGGSDDHSGLNVARMFTEVPGVETPAELMSALAAGRGVPRGRGASPLTLAHNLYSIAYQFYDSKFNFERLAGRDIVMQFLEKMLKPEAGPRALVQPSLKISSGPESEQKLMGPSFEDMLRQEGEGTIIEDPDLKAILGAGPGLGRMREERWFKFVDKVTDKVLHRFGSAMFDQLSGGDLFNIFTTIGAAGSLFTMTAPYFISFGLLGRGRAIQGQVRRKFGPPGPDHGEDRVKVAHFTDTFYEINGVARTLQQMAGLAQNLGKDLRIVTCINGEAPTAVPSTVVNFPAVETYELPVYREQKLFVPPFLSILRHVYEEGYTYIHSSTPGPVGLAALAAARILNLPISGTYHTAIPEYAKYLTGDDSITSLVWRYTLWYYSQLEKIYTPSADTAEMLVQKGLSPDKMVVYPRGVDTDRFHPSNRSGFYEKRYGLGRKIKLLYTGRVSREKNMHLLTGAFKKLAAGNPDVHLVIVGEGPYLAEMKAELEGRPALFTGWLRGRELLESYAGADLFVFPSTTDTFGNVILEAQASGLPVVVTDRGGPQENLRPGLTGLIVPGENEPSLHEAMSLLVSNPLKLKQMGREARKYAEGRSLKQAFLDHWRLYEMEKADNRPTLAKAG